VIAPAIWQFAIFGTVTLGLGFAFGRFAFGERIETLKSRIEGRDEKIAELREKLIELKDRESASVLPDDLVAKVTELKAEIGARFDVLEKGSLGAEQLTALKLAASTAKSGIFITRAIDATDREAIYQQFLATFTNEGWVVHHGIVYRDDAAPESGLSLLVPTGADQQALNAIRSALYGARLLFAERAHPDPNFGMPQLLFSPPQTSSRARLT
jgi:hypothetical protein